MVPICPSLRTLGNDKIQVNATIGIKMMRAADQGTNQLALSLQPADRIRRQADAKGHKVGIRGQQGLQLPLKIAGRS